MALKEIYEKQKPTMPGLSDSSSYRNDKDLDVRSYASIYNDLINWRRPDFKKIGDLYDMPSVKYFKIFFHFGDSDSYNTEPTNGNSNAYRDAGLLAPTFMLEGVPKQKGNGYDFMDKESGYGVTIYEYYKYNSAWAYLKNNGEEERAALLKYFILLLSDISANYPWYFNSIEGLDQAIDRTPFVGKEFKIEEERKKISIKCLPDAIDDRIGTLLDLYRSITYSWITKREILPANLRKFDMSIYVFEAPIAGITKKLSKLTESATDIADFTSYGEKYAWYAKNMWEDGVEGFTQGVPEYNGKKTQNEMYLSYKMFEFRNCEIDYNSSKTGLATLNNAEGVMPTYSIDISFDDCFEHRFNHVHGAELGDMIILDQARLLITSELQYLAEDKNNERSQDFSKMAKSFDNLQSTIHNKLEMLNKSAKSDASSHIQDDGYESKMANYSSYGDISFGNLGARLNETYKKFDTKAGKITDKAISVDNKTNLGNIGVDFNDQSTWSALSKDGEVDPNKHGLGVAFDSAGLIQEKTDAAHGTQYGQKIKTGKETYEKSIGDSIDKRGNNYLTGNKIKTDNTAALAYETYDYGTYRNSTNTANTVYAADKLIKVNGDVVSLGTPIDDRGANYLRLSRNVNNIYNSVDSYGVGNTTGVGTGARTRAIYKDELRKMSKQDRIVYDDENRVASIGIPLSDRGRYKGEDLRGRENHVKDIRGENNYQSNKTLNESTDYKQEIKDLNELESISVRNISERQENEYMLGENIRDENTHMNTYVDYTNVRNLRDNGLNYLSDDTGLIPGEGGLYDRSQLDTPNAGQSLRDETDRQQTHSLNSSPGNLRYSGMDFMDIVREDGIGLGNRPGEFLDRNLDNAPDLRQSLRDSTDYYPTNGAEFKNFKDEGFNFMDSETGIGTGEGAFLDKETGDNYRGNLGQNMHKTYKPKNLYNLTNEEKEQRAQELENRINVARKANLAADLINNI